MSNISASAIAALGFGNFGSGSFINSGSAISSGSAIQSGSAIASGSTISSGSAIQSGSAIASGSAIQSASALASGSAIQSGSAISSGSAIQSGSAIASGSAIQSGSAINISASAVAAGSVYIPGSRPIPIIPAEQHRLNIDTNPIIVRKKPVERLNYIQNVSLKFLKPPQPAQPGDITIVQESDVQAPPAPPLHITQKPPAPLTPAPIIIRERPPKPPSPIAPRNITIPGRVIPPPPRKVIVERLPQIPPKPQDIIVERWLGYKRRARNVNFLPAAPIIPAPAPKNVLIQWDSPDVDVRQAFHFLGVQQADPVAYAATFGATLADASQLPREVSQFPTPAGETLAVNSNSDIIPALVGAVSSLKLVNLACNGLAEYAPQL